MPEGRLAPSVSTHSLQSSFPGPDTGLGGEGLLRPVLGRAEPVITFHVGQGRLPVQLIKCVGSSPPFVTADSPRGTTPRQARGCGPPYPRGVPRHTGSGELPSQQMGACVSEDKPPNLH